VTTARAGGWPAQCPGCPFHRQGRLRHRTRALRDPCPAGAHQGFGAYEDDRGGGEQRNRDTRSVVARSVIKMYRKAVDHATRNDIAAAAAAHHELGRDYDSAVAEVLIERIGAEIDQRVDARLGAVSRGSGSAAEVSQASGRQQAMWTGAAVGAGMTGIVVLIVNARHATTDLIASVITVWVIIAIAALATTLARRYRNPRHE